MRNRFPALLLALLLTSPVLLSGCGGDPAETTADTVPADTAAEETETAALRSADLLPASDFGGADYVIIGREYAKLGALPAMEFVVEELTGDIINDTIYKRNQTVEENFNVNISAITGTLRCGGDVFWSTVMDLTPQWLIGLPMLALFALVIDAGVWPVALAMQMENIIKTPLSMLRIRSGKWIHDVTRPTSEGGTVS